MLFRTSDPGHSLFCGSKPHIKEGNVLFNNVLKMFNYSYMEGPKTSKTASVLN